MTVWKLKEQEKGALLDRFLRYVRIDTQSDDAAEAFPTTEKQKDLARLLVAELKALGCADAAMDAWGYVFATAPSNLPPGHPEVPTLGFLAHLDTYPGTSGKDVRPQVVTTYAGGDLALQGTGESIPTAQNPNLSKCLGHTLVHTDGTTLLGADDKAGIAEIMTLLAWLQSHPEFLHG